LLVLLRVRQAAFLQDPCTGQTRRQNFCSPVFFFCKLFSFASNGFYKNGTLRARRAYVTAETTSKLQRRKHMKTVKMLTAASVVALMAAAPALADQAVQADTRTGASYTAPNANNPDTPDMPTVTKKDIKNGWNKTKNAVTNTADKAGDAISDTARKIKAAVLNNDPTVKAAPVVIDASMTASGMIGKPVYDEQHKKIATVEDVILDNSGKASMIVVKDGGFAGIGGKLAAFDYGAVVSRGDKGDIIAPLTKKSLDAITPFTYDATAASGKTQTLPAGGYSVAKLMNGEVLDAAGEKLANIDNLSFRNGRADLVIASYGQVLSMGGDKVAINFDTAQLVRTNDDVSMKLSTAQTRQFHAVEKAAD
jgi:uncharacterized protein YrrD